MALREKLPVDCPYNHSFLQRMLLGKKCVEGCTGINKVSVVEEVTHESGLPIMELVDKRLICGAVPLEDQLGDDEVQDLFEKERSGLDLITKTAGLTNPRTVDYDIYH